MAGMIVKTVEMKNGISILESFALASLDVELLCSLSEDKNGEVVNIEMNEAIGNIKKTNCKLYLSFFGSLA